jgi:hypothetical protein
VSGFSRLQPDRAVNRARVGGKGKPRVERDLKFDATEADQRRHFP